MQCDIFLKRRERRETVTDKWYSNAFAQIKAKTKKTKSI